MNLNDLKQMSVEQLKALKCDSYDRINSLNIAFKQEQEKLVMLNSIIKENQKEQNGNSSIS